MRIVTNDDFLSWAAEHGIGPDPRFAHSQYLMFLHRERDSRFWEYPEDPGTVPHFVSSVVDAAGLGSGCWIYPGVGYWHLGQPADSWPVGRTRRAILEALGIPAGHVGAVEVADAERSTLEAILSLQVMLGPAAMIDAVAIPADGTAVLFFEHNRVVHAEFSDSARLHAAVRDLARAGYELPAELPDQTFKPVSWLAKKDS